MGPPISAPGRYYDLLIGSQLYLHCSEEELHPERGAF